jgi:hypothetical protein
VVEPPERALRRRARELHASACRELKNDEDSGALLLFYAAECALKAFYMARNNLKDTEESRGTALPARHYSHNLVRLISVLNIPRASLKEAPAAVLVRSGVPIDMSHVHQAWRYGEKINNTPLICDWLISIVEWCRRN